mmetsp:Transcript_31210/g.70247  ORF Transcript_31210/g.70247 Transcript_31210/m.70247 type:complete len:92 (+) Transcript_31210:521-796(+)
MPDITKTFSNRHSRMSCYQITHPPVASRHSMLQASARTFINHLPSLLIMKSWEGGGERCLQQCKGMVSHYQVLDQDNSKEARGEEKPMQPR